jgi:mannose-6-phosphate isomerase-like protein (cupin superfamily)
MTFEIPAAGEATRFTDPRDAPNAWVDQLRGPAMSLGTYSLAAGGTDDQLPHREDEIYVVISGRATLDVEGQRLDVVAGSAVYVSAGQAHRFTDIVENLTVLVVFAPPYSGR